MARYHHNIEPSVFRRGEYVGYGQGTVWSIRKTSKGWWTATPRDTSKKAVSRTSLAEISALIDNKAKAL